MTRYFLHPESNSAFSQPDDAPVSDDPCLEEVDEDTWREAITRNGYTVHEFDAGEADVPRIAGSATVEPCKWCGTPVLEQTDPPADYCSHGSATGERE